MTAVARVWWTACHLMWSSIALLAFALTRRGSSLAFTHYQDLDADGLDRQMGPLVDALARRDRGLCEVTLCPLSRALFDDLRQKRRLCVSYAAIAALARVLDPRGGDAARRMRARTRVARWLLRAIRPRALYVIDESGSGQPLVRAGRQLGIRVVGVQHGDFRPGNHQYDLAADRAPTVEPVDVLCVWSTWFRERLLRISPIYTDANTLVTGRLRYPTPDPASREPGPVGDPGRVRVLVAAEPDAAFGRGIEPFVGALVSETNIDVELRPHPADRRRPERSLEADLLRCDVVLGIGSSALLEALRAGRPVVVAVTPELSDRAGLVAAGLATPCADPAQLAEVCRLLSRWQPHDGTEHARDRVWGGAPEDPVEAILRAGRDATDG